MSFSDRMEAACKEGILPGAIVAACNTDGSFEYKAAFDFRPQDNPPTPRYELNSVLRLASATKLITSIAVLQIVDRGLIGLDDDVGKVLPELGELKVLVSCEEGKEPVFEEKKRPITLRLLLTHAAGFGSGLLEPSLRNYRIRTGSMDSFNSAKTVAEKYLFPLARQPDTAWSYNAGHDWAGKVLEKLTGMSLDEHVQRFICEPLGLTTITFWHEQRGFLNRMPQPSKRGPNAGAFKKALMGGVDDEDAPLCPAPEWPSSNYTECMGGESAKASMPDYLALLRSLLANDERLLKKATVDEMFSPQMSAPVRASLNSEFGWFRNIAPGTYPPHIELDWGLGALLTAEDDEKGRGKHTLLWSGVANLFWFIDRQKGLCGIFGTQLLPSGDNKVRELTSEWEKEMYRLSGAAQR